MSRDEECPPEPAIRVVMMPRDTNVMGTIFGGVLLSYIDQAAFIGAREAAPHRFVTVAMDAVEFKQPVCVGDVVSFYTAVLSEGRTSLRMRVTVFAERYAEPGSRISVTEAEVVMVAIDEDRKPVSLR